MKEGSTKMYFIIFVLIAAIFGTCLIRAGIAAIELLFVQAPTSIVKYNLHSSGYHDPKVTWDYCLKADADTNIIVKLDDVTVHHVKNIYIRYPDAPK